MEFIKQSEVTTETLVGENENYRYIVEVSRNNNEVVSVTMNVDKKDEGNYARLGYLAQRSNQKTVGIQKDELITTHTGVFEDFLSELE